MCTPEEGCTIGLCAGSSSVSNASVNGPVALTTPCAGCELDVHEAGKGIYLGVDIPFLTREVVAHVCARQLAVGTCLEQLRHFHVVRDDGALLNGGHDQRDVHPGVVVLT